MCKCGISSIEILFSIWLFDQPTDIFFFHYWLCIYFERLSHDVARFHSYFFFGGTYWFHWSAVAHFILFFHMYETCRCRTHWHWSTFRWLLLVDLVHFWYTYVYNWHSVLLLVWAMQPFHFNQFTYEDYFLPATLFDTIEVKIFVFFFLLLFFLFFICHLIFAPV